MCMCKLGFACLLPTERFGQVCLFVVAAVVASFNLLGTCACG